jgi:hypothetical protein
MNDYRRTVEQLDLVASKFWPQDLSQQEAELSIIPKLLETQDAFIAILSLDLPGIEELFEIVDTTKMSGNLFLKHLIILADFGGEPLKRVNQVRNKLFPDATIRYLWSADNEYTEERQYVFKAFPEKAFSNSSLGVDGKSLLRKQELTNIQKDAIALLLMGSSSIEPEAAQILSRCEIGNYVRGVHGD